MKNLIKMSVIAAGMFAFGSAQAANTQLSGFVEAVCEVTGLASNFNFQGGEAGTVLIDIPVGIQCNDGDGAVVELRSSEGGLESDDNEDLNFDYRARVFSPGIGLDLTLVTPDGVGPNDQSVTADVAGSVALAGGVNAALGVTLLDDLVFAGGYSDTLALDITAQ